MTEPYNFSQNELSLLSSKRGLKELLKQDKPDFHKTLEDLKYQARVKELQIEMIKMQSWIVKRQKRLMIIFEGRDLAGKGSAIRQFSEHLNPRNMRSVALSKPTIQEKKQWYFRRYIREFPIPGEIVFFNRSWYNRAIVEPVNGFCSKNKYNQFMDEVNQFEEMIMNDGMILIKFWFSISKKEQKHRLEEVEKNPLKKWRLSDLDYKAQSLWDDYTDYKDRMFEVTDRNNSPWIKIDANDYRKARIEAMEYVLGQVFYK